MPVDIFVRNELRVPRWEWICRGLPFPLGELTDSMLARLRLTDKNGGHVPLASEVMVRWPDGSVRWLLLQFPVSFESKGRTAYRLDWPAEQDAPEDGPSVTLSRSDEGWEVENGPLRFSLPATGSAFVKGLTRAGEGVLSEVRAEIVDDGGTAFISELAGEPRVEHATGKMLVVSRPGVHRDAAGKKLFSCVFRVTVFAGTDEIEVEYQFIHDEPFRDVPARRQNIQGIGSAVVDVESPGMRELRTVRLVITHDICKPTQYATCQLSARGSAGLITSPKPIRALLTDAPKTALYDFMIDADVLADGELIGRSHGWVAVGDSEGGLAASLRKFVQQWPKAVSANDHEIVVDLWPEESGPLHIFQGQAKSHQVKLLAYDGDVEQARLPDWHFAYQFPVVLSSPDWFIGSGALGPVFRYQPTRYPGIEKKFRLEFEQFLGFDRLLGMMDYGDYEDLGGASWGRADEFMSNLEHDFPQSVWLQFVRTGSYRYMDVFEAAARHVIDVDIVHFDDRHDEVGGWRAHGSRHVMTDAEPSCHASHMWTEGLLAYYFYCGYVPALDAARGVADLLVRRVEAGGVRAGARERGWPLIALCSVYQATGEQRYADAATAIVESFADGPDPLEEDGGLSGGWGPIPYQQAVMGSIAALGLTYYHQTFGDELSRELLLRIYDWLASDAVRTPEGLYLSMPGNETSMSYVACSDLREGLGYAWELTGDEKYLRLGLRDIEENMTSTIPNLGLYAPLTTKHGYEVVQSTGTRISIPWRENLRFMHYADRAGLLRDF